MGIVSGLPFMPDFCCADSKIEIRFQINMEKGMTKRGSVRGDENTDVDRPSVVQHIIKKSNKSVVRDQLVVDGRLSSDESTAFEREGTLEKYETATDAESVASSRTSLKRRSSASSTTSTSTAGSKRRK